MTLKQCISRLNKQIDQLNKTDGDAETFNKAVNSLVNEISEDIRCTSTVNLVDMVNDFKDQRAQAMGDSNINSAISRLNSEINTIERAIEAQERAAKALDQAKR